MIYSDTTFSLWGFWRKCGIWKNCGIKCGITILFHKLHKSPISAVILYLYIAFPTSSLVDFPKKYFWVIMAKKQCLTQYL